MHADIFKGAEDEWDGYVCSHPHSTNYHRFSWKKVIEKSFGHKTLYISARDEEKRIRGVLPLVHMKSALFGNFLVSVPFFNYGGVLSDDEKAEEAIRHKTGQILGEIGADYVEFRQLQRPEGDLPSKEHKVTMVLELQRDADLQWKTFDSKLRNQIRKAMKSGLEIKIGGNELLEGFYDVFSRNMRDLGTPVYSKSFFKNVIAIFPNSTKIFSVFSRGEVVASGIATWFKDTLELPWASSNRDYRSLCPNNLLYWEVIRYAIEHGFRKFDFGRSTPDEGTYKFKEQWGARPVQLYWQYLMRDGGTLPELNPKNPKYRRAIDIWKKLPVRLTRILGPGIVKYIP